MGRGGRTWGNRGHVSLDDLWLHVGGREGGDLTTVPLLAQIRQDVLDE